MSTVNTNTYYFRYAEFPFVLDVEDCNSCWTRFVKELELNETDIIKNDTEYKFKSVKSLSCLVEIMAGCLSEGQEPSGTLGLEKQNEFSALHADMYKFLVDYWVVDDDGDYIHSLDEEGFVVGCSGCKECGDSFHHYELNPETYTFTYHSGGSKDEDEHPFEDDYEWWELYNRFKAFKNERCYEELHFVSALTYDRMYKNWIINY